MRGCNVFSPNPSRMARWKEERARSRKAASPINRSINPIGRPAPPSTHPPTHRTNLAAEDLNGAQLVSHGAACLFIRDGDDDDGEDIEQWGDRCPSAGSIRTAPDQNDRDTDRCPGQTKLDGNGVSSRGQNGDSGEGPVCALARQQQAKTRAGHSRPSASQQPPISRPDRPQVP